MIRRGAGHPPLSFLIWIRFVLCLGLALWGGAMRPVPARGAEPARDAPQYSAELTCRDDRGEEFRIGAAALLRGAENGVYRIRLDFDLGRAGAFSAFLLPEEKTLFVASHALAAYVAIPTQGDERAAVDLLPRIAAAFMPFGVPALTIREEERAALPAAFADGLPCGRERALYSVTFMGDSSEVALAEWNSPAVPFLPVRVDELRGWDEPDALRGSVLLKHIRGGELGLKEDMFEVPEAYSRYGSALNMLLYALAAQW